MKFSIVDALHDTQKSFYIKNEDYESLQWNDNSSKPTLKELETKRDQMQADYDAKKYQHDRAEQYPSITDVVVALAEKEEGDDTMWQEITALRQKVKADNPKP